jgi:hypothetical protein
MVRFLWEYGPASPKPPTFESLPTSDKACGWRRAESLKGETLSFFCAGANWSVPKTETTSKTAIRAGHLAADWEESFMSVPFENEVEPTPPLGIEPLLKQDRRYVSDIGRISRRNLRDGPQVGWYIPMCSEESWSPEEYSMVVNP